MKKLIFFQLGILFFLLNLGQINAASVYGANSEAGQIMKEIEQLKEDLGGYESDCDNISARIKIRMTMLPDEHVLAVMNDPNRNACLRKDLDKIEKALGRVAELAPKSRVACTTITKTENGVQSEIDIDYVADKIIELQARIDCLRKYGADNESKKDEECQDRTYYSQVYEDEYCKDSENDKIFTELRESADRLVEKWNLLKNLSNWQLDTSIDYDAIRQRADARAESWLKKNLSIKYKGEMFSFGIGYLTKTDKERLTFQGKKWSELIPDLADFPTHGITNEIFGQIETIYQDQKFAENFAELILEKEIFENINLEIATGLEVPLNCYQYSCNITKSSTGVSASTLPPNCTYPIKKLPDQTYTDGLKEKTRSLKQLLDSHNKK